MNEANVIHCTCNVGIISKGEILLKLENTINENKRRLRYYLVDGIYKMSGVH